MGSTISRRSLLVGMGAGVAALGGLSACAPTPSVSRPDPAGSPAGGPSAAPTDRAATDFALASWSLSEETPKPVLQRQIDAFAEAAGITISTVTYPYSEYLNQLTLQVRGGEFAGAVQLDVAWLGAMAALGKLRDLSAYATDRGYAQTALEAGQDGGEQLALPWTIGAIGLVANSALLEQAGVTEPPATIEDFEETLRALKGLGNGLIPYAASTKVAQLKDVLVWMQTFGSPLVAGDAVVIGDDASVEAVAWYKRLYDEGLIAPDVDRFDARALFGQGRAAMYDDAPVGRAAVLADAADPELGDKLQPLSRPVLSAGDDPRSLLWGHLLAVVDGEGADTAADYAQFVTSDESTVVDYFSELSLPPTTTAALESDVVRDDPFTSAFTERITATATRNPFWPYPQYAQIEAAIAEQVQAVLVGTAQPAEAMAAAGDAVQGLLG